MLNKEMIVAAQHVAFECAAHNFSRNPTGDAWAALETEMWAWQRLKHLDEDGLLHLLRDVSAKNWSATLRKSVCGK